MATLAVCFGFGRYGYGLFLPRFQQEFGGSVGALGAVTSIGYLGELVALLSVARMAGRVSSRWPIAIGVGSAALGMVLIGTAQGLVTLAIGVAISGMSPGWVWAPYSDVVAQTVRVGAREHALSMVSTGTTFGVMLAGPAALLTSQGWWRAAWLGAAAIAGVVACWNLAVLPREPRKTQEPHKPGARAKRSSVAELLTRAGTPNLFLAAVSSGLVGAAYWSFAGAAVSTANHGDHRLAPLLWTVIGVAGVTGVWTGVFVRRAGFARVFIAAQLVLAASTAMLGFAPSGWVSTSVSAVTYGVGFMVAGTLLPVWSAIVFADNPTKGFSMVIVCITVGAIVGPAVFGFVVDHFGTPLAFALATAIALATLAVCPRQLPARQP